MTEVDEQRIHEIFNRISGDYDKMNAIISFKQHDRWRAQTMVKMAVPEAAQILDLCCGTGDWTQDLARAVGEQGEVIGLDFSEKMLQVAEAKLAPLPNVRLIQGNAMVLPFAAERFDFVTIGYGLRNTPDYLQVLKEIFRVLKPGGEVVCIETSQPTLPVYKQIFAFYFQNIMPWFGKIFAKSYAEYRWLEKSARDFPDAKTLKHLFEQAGFTDVTYQFHGAGAAATHYGRKAAEPSLKKGHEVNER